MIEELIGLAKQMRAASARGEALDVSEDELAFYDALEVNDSAVKVLGEPTLVKIARELVEAVKRNVTIDWTVRDNVRAQLRVIVKRILRKYGYPPDKQEKATQTVLEEGGGVVGNVGSELKMHGHVNACEYSNRWAIPNRLESEWQSPLIILFLADPMSGARRAVRLR